MSSELARALGRIAAVLAAYLAAASVVLFWHADTFADRAVVKLLMAITGASMVVVLMLAHEGSRAERRERTPDPRRDDWAEH